MKICFCREPLFKRRIPIARKRLEEIHKVLGICNFCDIIREYMIFPLRSKACILSIHIGHWLMIGFLVRSIKH
jgi:hypothetical protein